MPASLEDTHLYYVSDEVATLPGALAGGADVFQLRMKAASDDEVLATADLARELCAAAGVPFILNDRPDLAARIGADGVHVGQDDGTIADAREIVGPELIIGRSTHAPSDLATSAGADYVAAGPVFQTPTKPGRPAVGLAYIRHVSANATVPWFAIGGIDLTTIQPVVEAGARRVVVVRAIRDSEDPEAAALRLRAALQEAPVGTA